MDLIDDVLSTLNLKGALYFRTDFSGGWGVTVPEHKGAARFHLVIQGRCHVRLASGERIVLGPGDLVLIPGGRSHELSDDWGRETPPLETVLAEKGYKGEGVLIVGEGDPKASTQMVCGHFTFRSGADHPLLRALPSSLVFSAADRAREPILDDTLRLITQRIFETRPGSKAAVVKLSEAAFIELIRAHAAQHGDLAAILAAFEDRQIARALKCIHEQASAPWTVEGLARESGMSRSRFAERFRDLLGLSPMAYLSEWRLQKALAMLDGARISVQEIAAESGYQSPAAFTRAFAGRFGVPPSEYRRTLN
ncbi:MAG: AraC family transcriptional regulator [Parvularculaceae bacterium]|nr:AraC family transcriptional regulator [Parvularculaceae bacterium]